MWRRMVAYLLFGLGFLTVTFFRHYQGDLIPSPFLFYLIGLVMFVGGFFFLRYTPTVKDAARQKLFEESIAQLKQDGEKITVDFAQCELKEHNYMEEKDRYGTSGNIIGEEIESRIQLFKMLGNPTNNAISVNVVQTVIIYRHNDHRSGKKEQFVSRVIAKDKISLSICLDQQQKTILYVDRENRNQYYYDLDFLYYFK